MSASGSSPGRRQRTPSADVERELLAAAEAVLTEQGPDGLTVRAVAARAGIAPMGVYNRLGGKDGLLDALLIRGFDRLRAAIQAGDEPDMLQRLRACGLRYRQFALANRQFYAIMFERPILPGRDSAAVAGHAMAAFDALVRNVESAVATGQISAEDPREAAQLIWSSVHGAAALELNGLCLTPDPAATYRAMLEVLLRGLAGQLG